MDTGIGIPPEKLDDIFEAFTQAEQSTTRNFGGTGLGLSITKQLAQRLGGEISVVSEPGQGSTFSLTIPLGLDLLTQPHLEPGIFKAQSPLRTSATPPSLSGRILLAEDNHSNQKLMSILLRRVGLQTIIAEDGLQALDRVHQQKFDLILMDMQMPNMNGFQTTKALRKLGIDTPIIALTARVLKTDQQECLQAGCDAYLAKPIDHQKLYSTLEEYLPGQRDPGQTPEPVEATAPSDP